MTGATSQGKDYLPRLAAKFLTGIASDCTEFKLSGDKVTVRRPVYAGKCSKQVEFTASPAVFSVRPNVFGAPKPNPKTPQIKRWQLMRDRSGPKSLMSLQATEKRIDLTEADFIISGGRSLRAPIISNCCTIVHQSSNT